MTDQVCRFAGALLSAVAWAGAQTNAPARVEATTTNAAPIVVTASRLERTSMEMTANVTVITADQIQGSGLIDTAQALETLGGVYLRRYSGNPSQVDIAMRGFGENSHGRVLIMVDGVRINNADMAVPNLQRVPLQNVERIEIIRGPEATLYGDYAVSGVINIITKAPTTERDITVSAYAGSDDTYGAAISLRGPIDDTTFYSASSMWDRSSGWRDNADYRTVNITGSVTEKFTDRIDATISAFYNDNKYGMPGALSREQMKYDPQQTLTPDDEYKMKLWGATLSLSAITQNDARFTLLAAASRRDSTADMVSWGTSSGNMLDTFQLSPRAALPFEIGGLNNTLTLGGDMYYERLAFRNSSITTGARSYDSDLNRLTGALYAQNELELTSQLSFLLGGRLERSRLRADTLYYGAGQDTDSTCQNGSSWDAGLLFRPIDDLKIYARVGSVYRYPFLDEQVSYNGGYPIGLNDDLKPERGMNYEVGTEYHFLEEFTFSLSAYQMDMKDEITVDPYTWRQVNMNKTRHQGVDLELAWQRRDVATAAIDYSYVRSKFTDGVNDDDNVPLAPRQMLTLRGELSLHTDFALLAALRAVSDQYMGSDFSNKADKLPGYATLDLGLRYKPSFVQGLQIILSCDNIFDNTYANMGYFVDMSAYGMADTYGYYPANGRTWRLAASYSF